jgi:hypothetical protein
MVAIAPVSAAIAVSAVVVLGWVILEALVLLLDIGQEVFAKLLRLLHIVGIRAPVI